VAGLRLRRIGGTRDFDDLNDSKMSGLPVEFSNGHPIAHVEAGSLENCGIGCVAVPEVKKPTAMIALQFAAPLLLGPEAANKFTVSVSQTRTKIKMPIK
jgi:hypothetical protein